MIKFKRGAVLSCAVH